MKTFGYAAHSSKAPLAPFAFERRELRPNDVAIEILFAGVCHTDLHMARNDWGIARYPMVPGHEIVGRVTAVGGSVKAHKVGDQVAVGTAVDSCGKCDQCNKHHENYCREGATMTYAGNDRVDGSITQGGYAKHIVVKDAFVVPVPKGLDLARVAPLLCAGITTYSPLKTWGVRKGSRVAVVGIGGLGHLAVKFAVALGAEVTVITRSEGKAREGTALGAQHTLLSTDADAMKAKASTFDLIIDTIPVEHEVQPYVDLLDVDGTLVLVGAIFMQAKVAALSMALGRRRISGSGAGGIAETREMLELCAAKEILPECETIAMKDISQAFERMERGDVRYRFVIDMATL